MTRLTETLAITLGALGGLLFLGAMASAMGSANHGDYADAWGMFWGSVAAFVPAAGLTAWRAAS